MMIAHTYSIGLKAIILVIAIEKSYLKELLE
jgi:hypothetical protein